MWIVGIVALVLLGVGVWWLIAPESGWRFHVNVYSWQYENPKSVRPSKAAIRMTRLIGVVFINGAIALVMILD